VTPHKWEVAKLPVNQGGLGLQNPLVVSPAAFAASLGLVKRFALKTPDEHSLAVFIRSVANPGTTHLLSVLATQVEAGLPESEDDVVNPCPPASSLELMPTQKALSSALYKVRADSIQESAAFTPPHRALFRSMRHFIANRWTLCIPSLRCFKVAGGVFTAMLRTVMFMTASMADKVEQCVCGAKHDSTFIGGHHWHVTCTSAQAGRTARHNRIRDLVVEMYKWCGISVGRETRGLYAHLGGEGSQRPADVLVPASATPEGESRWALDISIVDPSCATYLAQGSASQSLRAAKIKEDKKVAAHKRFADLAAARGTPLDFKVIPLVFESTGAMGPSAKNWFDYMVKLHNKVRHSASLSELGAPSAFSANSFSSHFSQRLSLVQARHQAEGVETAINESLPSDYQFAAVDACARW